MSKCSICGSTSIQDLLAWRKFHIKKCEKCKLLYTTPLPSDEELIDFYQGFMFKRPEEYEILKRLKSSKKELQKIFSLQKENALSEKRFLDYGAGTGTTYRAIKDLGFKAYYYDIDEDAKQFTKLNFGLTDDYIIEDLAKENVYFDYIFSDNVIEHVKDPHGFVKDLFEKLNEGGTMIIKTPNGGNTEAYFNPFLLFKVYVFTALKYNSPSDTIKAFFKRFWHCDPPRHIYSFSRKNLIYLTQKLNLENAEYEILFDHTPWFVNTITKEFFSKDKKLNIFKSILYRVVVLPWIPIEIFLQIMKHFLLGIRILSPGQIMLKIHKPVA